MPIQLTWDNDQKKTIIFRYEGQWELNDFFRVTEEGNKLLDTVNYKVNMVLDVQNSKTIPNGFINAISNTAKRLHPNTGVMVMVGINPFARALIGLYRKLYPPKASEPTVFLAANYEEAYTIMEENHLG